MGQRSRWLSARHVWSACLALCTASGGNPIHNPPAFAPLPSRSMAALLASASDRPLAPQVALTRTALDRVIANKPLFFACPPTLAAAVAAPECGGLGQAALRGTPGMVAGEDSYKRCSELLLKALQGNARGITSLVSLLRMLRMLCMLCVPCMLPHMLCMLLALRTGGRGCAALPALC